MPSLAQTGQRVVLCKKKDTSQPLAEQTILLGDGDEIKCDPPAATARQAAYVPPHL